MSKKTKSTIRNVAIIYQPHFMTSTFRVATSNQQSSTTNYIVITCSPCNNGVYAWDKSDIDKVDIGYNGSLPLYEVPMSICKKLCSLEELKSQTILEVVYNQQDAWFKGMIKNGTAYKKDKKPNWMLKK